MGEGPKNSSANEIVARSSIIDDALIIWRLIEIFGDILFFEVRNAAVCLAAYFNARLARHDRLTFVGKVCRLSKNAREIFFSLKYF